MERKLSCMTGLSKGFPLSSSEGRGTNAGSRRSRLADDPVPPLPAAHQTRAGTTPRETLGRKWRRRPLLSLSRAPFWFDRIFAVGTPCWRGNRVPVGTGRSWNLEGLARGQRRSPETDDREGILVNDADGRDIVWVPGAACCHVVRGPRAGGGAAATEPLQGGPSGCGVRK